MVLRFMELKSILFSPSRICRNMFKMDLKILMTCLIIISIAESQKASHRSYDWRTSSGKLDDWPQISSLLPYSGSHAMRESYPAIDDSSRDLQYDSRINQYDMKPFVDSFFSSDELDSSYKYLDDPLDSSYSAHHDNHPMNITMERLGGFAGSGDTLGFGAYEHPVKTHSEDIYPEEPTKLEMEFPELFKVSRKKQRLPLHHRNPMLIHPIPPPL